MNPSVPIRERETEIESEKLLLGIPEAPCNNWISQRSADHLSTDSFIVKPGLVIHYLL